MMTVAEDRDGVARAIAGGARGYVTKDANREELAATVVRSPSRVVRPRSADAAASLEGTATPPTLTEREMQVLDGHEPWWLQRRDRA